MRHIQNSTSSRSLRSMVVAGLSLIATLGIFASPALAKPHYIYNTTFETNFKKALEESNNKAFSNELAGLAVDNSTGANKGDIYVVDGGKAPHGVVDKLEVKGSSVKFLCELGGSNMQVTAKPCASSGVTKAPEVLEALDGVAVGPSGEVYVVNAASAAKGGEKVDKFNAAGEYVSQLTGTTSGVFSKPTSVAVGAGGEIYVTDNVSGAPVVDKFAQNGTFEYSIACNSITKCGANETWLLGDTGAGIAVGSDGKLYVVDTSHVVIDKFSSAGVFETSLPTVSSSSLGVNPTSNSLFVTHGATAGGTVAWYSAAGLLEEEFSSLTPVRPKAGKGLAVTSAGVVYVLDNTEKLVEMWELAEPPTVGACKVSSVTASSAKLEGEVNPGGNETKYKFEYGARTPTSSVEGPQGATSTSASVVVADLKPATTYHYRVLFTPNVGSPGAGVEQTLTTGAGQTTATLSGTVMTNPTATTTFYFEYGTGVLPYGESSALESAGSGTTAEAESAVVTGLDPETLYDCRIAAESSGGLAEAANVTFVTKSPVEGVKTGAASSATTQNATLNGSLNPEGTAAEYFFEYGPTTSYGNTTMPATSSSGAEVQVSAPVGGLVPYTQYYFRLVTKRVIEGVSYTTVGQDQSFGTPGGALVIEAEQASAITPFAATLGGTLDPENSPVSYYFEYGTTTVTEHAFVPVGLVSGYGTIAIAPQTIQNLSPGTEYHYRLIAENAFGSVEGPEQTFKTLPASAPTVGGAAVGEVGQFGASVSASIDPQGLATNYEVELEIEGSTMPVTAASAGEGDEPIEIAYTLSSLVPGTAYQVRVVAWNAAGEAGSQTQSFTTQAVPSDTLTQPLTPVLVPAPRIAEVKEPVLIKPTTKTLTRAQKLAEALKACGKEAIGKRAKCEKAARKKYAPVEKAKKKKR